MKASLFIWTGFLLCLAGCAEEQGGLTGNPIFGAPSVKVGTLKPKALSILESSLKSKNADLRANAVEVAVVTQQKQLLPQLIELTADPTPVVRFSATVALGDLHYSGLESHIRRLLNDPDAKVQIAAAYSLAKLDQEQYAQRLREATTNSDPSVRANAVLLLGKLGNHDDIPLLYRVLRDDSSTDMVRMQAVESIARLGDEQMYRSKLWALLISKFNDDRVMGIRGMGALGTPEAIDAIKLTMLNDDVEEVRLAAAQELARHGYKNGLKLVQEYLKQNVDFNNPGIGNSTAIMAIGYLKDPELNTLLPKILSSSSEQIRLLGAESVLLQLPGQ